MMLLVLLIPCLFMLVVAMIRVPEKPGLMMFAVATLVAASLPPILVTTSHAWRNGTEIAWTGIEAPPGKSLTIGGSFGGDVIGWPNGKHWPLFEVKGTQGSSSVLLSVTRSLAFLESNGRPLTGKPLRDGLKSGDYTFRVRPRWFGLAAPLVEIEDSSGNKLAEFRLAWAGRHRVLRLDHLLRRDIMALRASTQADKERALGLERWARTSSVLFLHKEAWFAHAEDQPHEIHLPVPEVITIRWPGRSSLRLRLMCDTNNSLRASFLPPFRHASPLPPKLPYQREDGTLRLLVAADPLLDQAVFLIPAGGRYRMCRQEIAIAPETGTIWPVVKPGTSEPSKTAAPNPVSRTRDASRGIIAKTTVYPGKNAPGLELSLVRDLPSLWLLMLGVLLAWLAMVWAARLLRPGVSPRTFTAMTGVTAAVWSILLYRLVLSLRYCLRPSELDRLAINGQINALVALALFPSLLLILMTIGSTARRYPQFKTTAISRFLVLLTILSVVEFFLVKKLWLTAPHSGFPFLPGLLPLIVLVVFQFRRPLLEKALGFYEAIVIAGAPQFWASVESQQSGRKKFPSPEVLFVCIVVILGSVLLLLFRVVDPVFGFRILSEIVAPLLIVWILAALLIGALEKAAFDTGAWQTASKRFVRISTRMVPLLVMIVLEPVIVGDVGATLGSLAVLIPVVIVLLLSARNRIALVATGFLTVLFLFLVLAFSFPEHLSHLPGSKVLGQLTNRALVHKKGIEVLRELIRHPILQDDSSPAAPSVILANAVQHTWQNKAMAHEGGMWGLGFGRGPARLSAVPMATVEYDSVFSTFVVAEMGHAGGLLLLLLYALPLAWVLWWAHPRFDSGAAFATVVTTTLFLEAATHAAMNYGILPFSGRNLPLLAVNSKTDILKWLILITFGLHALLWRGLDSDVDTRETNVPGRILNRPTAPAFVFGFLIILVVVGIARSGLRIIQDSSLDRPYSDRPIFESVQELIDQGRLVVDQKTKKIEISNDLVRNGMSWLEQDVAFFNSLSEEERLIGVRSPRTLELARKLGRVTTLENYDSLMRQFQAVFAAGDRMDRPCLFRLTQRTLEDPTTAELKTTLVLQPNFDAGSSTSLQIPQQPEDIPHLQAWDSRKGQYRLVSGPSWVMGHWRTASADIGWSIGELDRIAAALEPAWHEIGSETVRDKISTLSIDLQLQEVLVRYCRAMGRELHGRLLARRNRWTKAPPRVALTILNGLTGEVLATGGWPRSARGWRWQTVSSGKSLPDEVVPSTVWLSSWAPRFLRSRYQGERSFDRMVLGSSAKPFTALTALLVHPRLGVNLRVAGPARISNRNGIGGETSVFGIHIADKGWSVHSSGGTRHPRDFPSYLTFSDNRYQVYLGFLGLAKDGNDTPAGIALGSVSRGKWEATVFLDGGKHPINRVPLFPHMLVFGPGRPRRLDNLDKTALAQEYAHVFGVAIRKDQRPRLFSLWTGDRADDLEPLSPNATWARHLRDRTPAGTNLALDTIKNPRQWVSFLMGGASNLWTNVELAAGFSTVVLGQPVTAHMLRTEPTSPKHRMDLINAAREVREGLAGVVARRGATAFSIFRKRYPAPKRNGKRTAVEVLKTLRVSAYAKTGTLRVLPNRPESSRFLLTLVRWENKSQNIPRSAITFSFFVENGGMGRATRWAARFLVQHEDLINRLLDAQEKNETAPTPSP